MSNAIEKKQTTHELDVWGKMDKIRELFAPNLTGPEFSYFVGLGKSLGANPFSREIWAIKFGSAPATIFLARDFYRKKAQEQPDYNGHTAVAVFENDEYNFDTSTGLPVHKYGLKNRGKLIGAYGLAWRKNVMRPFYKFVYFEEYDKKQSNWKTMQVTMIEKVAEAQVVRMGWQGIFQGTYSEDEQAVIESGYKPEIAPFIAPKALETVTTDGEVLTLTPEPIEPEQK